MPEVLTKRDIPNGHRGRHAGQWRLLAGGVVVIAALGGLIAAPAAASASRAGLASSASCPWVTSREPTDQRVAQLMGKMSLSQKISMVEGHGTSNPYVFYTPAISSLCIPAMASRTARPGWPSPRPGTRRWRRSTAP